MSFLTSRATMLRSARPLAQRVASPRAFTVSARQLSLNEDNTNREDREGHVESHKQDSLKKQKDGEGHWKGELASNSEQAIKADKEHSEGSGKSIKDLQNETAEHAEKNR